MAEAADRSRARAKPAGGASPRSIAADLRRDRQRRRPIGRARLQRTAAAVSRAAFRPPVQDRSGATDGTVGAIDLGDHEPAAGGRPLEAGGAAARPGRTADDPDVARSGRRLFARPQDRPAQLRSRAHRFPRRRPPARSPHIRLSDAAAHSRFRPRASAKACRIRSTRRSDGGSPASASPRPSSSGPGRRRSARRPAPWRTGASSTPQPKSPRSAPIP